jgi:hypothetical protein|tara:strand:- start:773 stop:1060 length:288 start_codon:yes stop_codon:yes gene_type:complete
MPNIDVSAIDVVVVGGATTQTVDINYGPQGVRGTRIFGISADPRLVTTTKPDGVIVYDIVIVTATTEADYRVMYQKIGTGSEDWTQLIDLNLGAA